MGAARRRRTLRATIAVILGGALVLIAGPALAAVSVIASGEVSGGSVAARASASALRDAWGAEVVARGGAVPTPGLLPGPVNTAVTGVILTAGDGTTVTLQRARYGTGASPVFVANSPNPGTAVCTGNGLTLQGSAPRPSVIVGNAGCSNGNGFAFTSFGGAGENTTRDALEFTFSRPVLAFGAWFADLETRTDGLGVPAVLRLLDASGAILDEQQVTPVGAQDVCGGGASACGNNTTRWIGFVADPTTPVARMVVIVGDDELAGGALNVGVGFIGPTLVADTAGIDLAASAPAGAYVLGDAVPFELVVTDPGTLGLTDVAISSDEGDVVTCPTDAVTAGGSVTCIATTVVTQADVDAGTLSRTWAASGVAWGERLTADTRLVTVAVSRSPAVEVTLDAGATTYRAIGDVIPYDVVVRNSGTVTLTGVAVSSDLGPVTCPATASLAPGATLVCTSAFTVTAAGATIDNVARVSAAAGATPVDDVSDTVSVAFEPPDPVDPIDPVDPVSPAAPEPAGELASSGTTSPLPLMLGGLASIVVGAALLALRRRRTVD